MKSKKPKAICFHGFLGSEKDFESLLQIFDVFVVNLKPMQLNSNGKFESWDLMLTRVKTELENYFLNLNPLDQIYFFSYSFGSKVLFSLFESQFFKDTLIKINPIVALISTHFGLYKDAQELAEEKAARQALNQKLLSLLEKDDLNSFLQIWNSLPLFSNEKPITTDWTLEQIKHYFESLSQIQDKDLIDKMKLNFYIFYGSEDSKYKQQSERLCDKNLKNTNIFEVADRSHRLIRKQDLAFICKKVLNGY